MRTPDTTMDVEDVCQALDFAAAVDRYKRLAHRPFPTWSEILEVAISQGWRLVEPPGPLPTYTPLAPSGD